MGVEKLLKEERRVGEETARAEDQLQNRKTASHGFEICDEMLFKSTPILHVLWAQIGTLKKRKGLMLCQKRQK